MKRQALLTAATACTVSSVLCHTPASAEQASDFTVTSSSAGSVNGEFTITLKGSHLADLYAYEAKFSFEPDRLEVVKAESKLKGFIVSPIVKNNEITIAHTRIGNAAGEKGDLDIGRLRSISDAAQPGVFGSELHDHRSGQHRRGADDRRADEPAAGRHSRRQIDLGDQIRSSCRRKTNAIVGTRSSNGVADTYAYVWLEFYSTL